MGGVKEVDTEKHMAWTGGKPLADWSALEQPQTAIRPTQFRAQGVADVKSYTFRVQGLKMKLSKSASLESFCNAVWKHLQTCGLDTVAYVPDPADKTKMESVVTNHARFTAEYVKEQMTDIQQEWDDYDRNNSDEAKQFLLNSMQPDFKLSIEQIMEKDDTFADLWITSIRKIYENTYEYFNRLKNDIKKMTPLSYPGEDIDAWCTDLRT